MARTASWPACAGDRLRHGRHLHRREPLRGRVRARVRDQVAGVRMRAPMMSIHTVAAGGGSICASTARGCASARERRRQPRPGQLPARRAADGDRCQRDARAHPARLVPAGVRPWRRPAAGRRSCERFRTGARGSSAPPARHAEGVAEGFIDRGGRTWPTPSSAFRWRAATT